MKVSIVVISKNEPALAETLDAFVPLLDGPLDEVVVVDASAGRLDFIRDQRPWLKWVAFTPRPGAGVTIPEQRNLGVAEAIGDIIVFTDCGCVPEPEWLPRLLAPIIDGREAVTCGRTGSRGRSVYEGTPDGIARFEESGATPEHVEECPTINMAFRREVFEAGRRLRRVVRVRVRHRLQLACDGGGNPDPLRARRSGRARLG